MAVHLSVFKPVIEESQRRSGQKPGAASQLLAIGCPAKANSPQISGQCSQAHYESALLSTWLSEPHALEVCVGSAPNDTGSDVDYANRGQGEGRGASVVQLVSLFLGTEAVHFSLKLLTFIQRRNPRGKGEGREPSGPRRAKTDRSVHLSLMSSDWIEQMGTLFLLQRYPTCKSLRLEDPATCVACDNQ